MRYYLMESDRNYPAAPRIINWNRELDTRNLREGYYDKIEDRLLLCIQPNRKTEFLDVVSTPFFLMSEKMQECVALYEPNLRYKDVVLLDKVNAAAQLYLLPMLREVDCLTEHATFNLDHSELKEIEIDEDQAEDKVIFRIANVKKSYVVVRLDLLESLLRRGVYGLSVQEIKVRKGKGSWLAQEMKKSI